MKRHISILFLFISFGFILFAQKNSLQISGYIEDGLSGERLPGAVVFNSETSVGAQTNHYGFFTLKCNEEIKRIEISHMGYKTKSFTLQTARDTTLTIKLERNTYEINEVVVSSEYKPHPNQRIGQMQLTPVQISKIPMVLGETDVLKAYQLLPGVQAGMEGTAGMVVRGSDPGQNLVLLDGVPVYNVNHLFGFFSVFNPDAVKSSTLIKGTYPARYGGRASSVLDIRMKEGNNQYYTGTASIGLVSSKLFFEGPLIKNKTSIMVSARRTYIDLLSYPYQKWLTQGNGLWKYDFHDVNFKINHIINPHNRLYFSVYNGKDNYKYKGTNTESNLTSYENNGINWGNITSTMRWNYQPTPALFINTTLIYSNYSFRTHRYYKTVTKVNSLENTSILDLEFMSGITDLGGNFDVEYTWGKNHNSKFGAMITQHKFRPGVNIANISQFNNILKADTVANSEVLYNTEASVYAEDEFTAFSIAEIQAGIRATAFSVTEKTYFSIEPRISLKLIPSKKQWFGFAYSKTSQNVHFLTNSSIGFPTDQWLPITDKIKPIIAHQYCASYNLDANPKAVFTIEAFYKKMNNILEYKENANLKSDWQQIVEQGSGNAYGIELLAKKDLGKLTGWIAYTWSKSDRLFPYINNGHSFPYKYDRRHDFKICASYALNPNIEINANWVYNSGHAVTLPLTKYFSATQLEGLFYGYDYPSEIHSIESRNNFRMPDNHRLDLTINFHKKYRKLKRTISLGLYNVYANHNALYYDFHDGKLRSNSFIPMLPSFNYTLQF